MTSMRALLIGGVAALTGWAHAQAVPAASPPANNQASQSAPSTPESLHLGRLFYSEAQRDEMDRARGKGEPIATQGHKKDKKAKAARATRPEPQPPTVPMVFQFQGLLIQPGQSPMVILNGRMVPESQLPPPLFLQRNARYEVVGLVIKAAGKPTEPVRVGQTITLMVQPSPPPQGAR